MATQENVKGNTLPYTAKGQVVLDGQYVFPLSDSVDGLIGGNMNYRTKTTAGFGTNPYLAIDDYALVDLRVGIQDPDKKWSVQVFGHNVTNAYYWTNVDRKSTRLNSSH